MVYLYLSRWIYKLDILNIITEKKVACEAKKEILLANNTVNESRHYTPSTKEWYNSIYTYNKNDIKALAVVDNYVIRLIRSYFSLFSRLLEKKAKLSHLRIWMRRSSLIRILVSKAEIKHTNDKIVINLYVYNRQRVFYLNKINILRKKMLRFSGKISYDSKFKLITKKSSALLHKIKYLNANLLTSLRGKTILYKYSKNITRKLINISFLTEKLYLSLKRNLFLNNYKFKSTYIIPLSNIMKRIYNKEIVFNIVSLKYPYLDSNIYLQLIMIRLRNRKNRIANVLNRSLINIKAPRLIRLITLSDIFASKTTKQNISIKELYNSNAKPKNVDSLSLFFKEYLNTHKNNKNNESGILKSLRYKTFIGLRIEASGRLTKRITASRAVLKIKHVGSIRNIDSSYKGLSSTMSKGVIKSNLDFTKSYSKTRIGSYGLKGWVNSI